MDLIKNIFTWIGIDPRTGTLGGWGYGSLGRFFIQNSKLTANETFSCGGTVKNRFSYYFGLLNDFEKAELVMELLSIFNASPDFPQRTPALYQLISDAIAPHIETDNLKVLKTHLQTLGMNELTGSDELKNCYNTKIKQYHPDKVEMLADEIKELALNRTKQINASYEYLKMILSGGTKS